MIKIQIHGDSVELINEFPENQDQFTLRIEGVEITLWNRPELRDAIVPAVPVSSEYVLYAHGGTLTWAAGQYYKALLLKGTEPRDAFKAAKGYQQDLERLAALDDNPYEVTPCPPDCQCHQVVEVDFDDTDPLDTLVWEPDPQNLGYPTGDEEEPPKSYTIEGIEFTRKD